MGEKGVVKFQVCSWIALGNKTSVFVVQDKDHPDTCAARIRRSACGAYRWIHIQQVSEKKIRYSADPYWVTIAHHWIRFGPAHLNKHARVTAAMEAGACGDGGGGPEKAAEEQGHVGAQERR
jgi:hypothetical protein